MHEFGELSSLPLFEQCRQELGSVAANSVIEQAKLRHQRKLKQISEQLDRMQQPADRRLLDAVALDYLRSMNYNYSYGVLLRETDILVQEIVPKQVLIAMLHLGAEHNLEDSSRLDESLLEMLIKVIAKMPARPTTHFAMQVGEGSPDRGSANQVLLEQRMSEIRQEVEEREKTHYAQLLDATKRNLNTTIKQALAKQFTAQLQTVTADYDKRLAAAKSQPSESETSLSQALQLAGQRIKSLQAAIEVLNQKNRVLEKQQMEHDCLKEPILSEQVKLLQQQRSQLKNKQQELELALRNIHSKGEELALQKQAVLNPTDNFQRQVGIDKAGKQFAIEQLHSRLSVMERRIDKLSKDNVQVRQRNRQLQLQLQQQQQQQSSLHDMSSIKDATKLRDLSSFNQVSKLDQFKPQPKTVSVGVTEEQIASEWEPVAMVASQVMSEQGDEFMVDELKHRKQVGRLQCEMKVLKNRVRLLVAELN